MIVRDHRGGARDCGNESEYSKRNGEGEDSGMSWGKSGQTETTAERGAPTIPPGAAAALGISPENATSTSPQPDTFYRPPQPPPQHGSKGGHANAGDIFSSTKIR